MNCPGCGHENRPSAKFCGECGTPFQCACPKCGAELPSGIKFCDECGAAVSGATPAARPAEPAGARKIVSILFADLVGSTALHERLDPESARRFMESYYAAARQAVEGQGGTVTQFLGDGVKAVFGIPRVAEDDALRAVRAGVAMQEAFRALAEEQRGAVGETGLRVAVNTGEVVAQGETEIIGDPVNVAARLQERGRDGDVVIGESTQRLVASQVSLELLGSFDLKGRAVAVKAYRVVSLDAPGRGAATAFVGREEELARITAVYDRATRSPATHLAVLLGSPGLGKSRLIAEFARRTGETATVIAARCDAARGATFAPIAAAVRELLDIEAGASADAMQAAIEGAIPDDDPERARIAAGIVGLLTGSPGAPEEMFFVVRRFLAGVVATRPAVVIVDDLQWAEPLLLDLVEHLVQWGRELPLLVLIGARPELREVRSSLATSGGLVSDVVTLDGLDAGAAMRLAAGVIGAHDLPAAVAAKVLATTEGNPLYIGELVRMLVDEGALTRDGDRWIAGAALATVEMPPTIHALLAARIERLDPEACAILERAAVVGRQFSRSAVAGLLQRDVSDLDARLESLQRAELIERDTGWFLGEPALRFHHVLIRDAAYRRLLKGTRAELHERLANWIEGRVGDAPEHGETIGRHFEEAHRLLGELGPIDDAGQLLGDRAATRLASAGRRALEGDDVPLAAGLLGRALDRLKADDPTRADLALDWCEALLAAGDVTRSAEAIAELDRLAQGSDRLRAWHTCFAGQLTVLTAPEELSKTVELVAEATSSLASLDDAAGEAKGHFVQALALSRLGRVGACEASLDQALAAARRAGDRRQANTVLAIAPLAALWGPSPVTRASGRCLDVVRVLRITQGAPAVEAVALSCQGVLEALRGRTAAAHRMIASGREMVEELGIAQRLFETDVFAGFVALLEGDAPAAERNLSGAYEGLRDLGLGIDAARAAALLARALLAQDRIAEAEALSHESEALAGDDLKAAIAWRGVRAEALAKRGEHTEAVELAQAAVAIAAATDALLDHADARLALAVALRAAGRGAEAAAEEGRAVELWEAKSATLLAERARPDGLAVEATEIAHGPFPDEAAETAHAPFPGEASAAAVDRRRVRPNAASRLVLGIEAGFAARDRNAIGALLSESVRTEEHPTGVTYGREGQLESIERMLRLPNLEFRIELFATLGEALCLVRRRVTASGTGGGRFDVAEYEMDHFVLSEVDEHRRLRLFEVFAVDHLGEAIARLYERHAELLPEGPMRQRAVTTAHAAAFMLTQSREYPMEEVMVPDLEAVDHRIVGHELVGQFSSRWNESWQELARDLTFRATDVLALSSEALLRLTTTAGVWKVGGGAFETSYNALSIFGSDGRQARVEFFDIGHEAQALARFDELTADPSDRHVTQPPPRRVVRANAATRISEGVAQTIAASDAAALESWIAADLQCEHRPTGTSYGAREFMITGRSAMEAKRLDFEVEVIASLGDSLAVHCQHVSVEGLRESALADFGLAQVDEIVVVLADRFGKCRRMDVYSPEKLGDAIVRLYESYAESLPEGPARSRAKAVARSVAAWNGPVDLDRLAAALAPSSRNLDHRVLGTWSTPDADAQMRHWRLQLDLARDFAARHEDVLALEADALLVRMTYFGTARDSGGPFENRLCVLFTFGADGLVTDTEVFEAEGQAEALARFDELAASASPPGLDDVAAFFANAAVRALESATTALGASDSEAFGVLFAGDFRNFDRRALLLLDSDRDEFLAASRPMFEMTSATETTVMATRGDRLTLVRMLWHGAGGDIGPSEVEWLQIVEVDDRGNHIAFVWFDATDVDTAYAELDARFDAGEPAPGPMTSDYVRAVASRDWDAIAAMCAPGFVAYDHRPLAVLGTTRGPAAWAESHRALVELSADARLRANHVLPGPRSGLAQVSWYGSRDGGDFEMPFVSVLEQEGKWVRIDLYEPEQLDEARARFEELRPSSPRLRPTSPDPMSIPPSTASRLVDRIYGRQAMAEIEALRAFLADDFRFDDRTRVSQLTGGIDEWVGSLEYLWGESRARVEVRRIAAAGDRLVLDQSIWRQIPGEAPFEIDVYRVSEVDAAGKLRAVVLFNPEDRTAAHEELFERYVASGAEGMPAGSIEFGRGVNAHDLVRVRSGLCDDFVLEDHRWTGLGRVDGADAYIESVRAMQELLLESRTDFLYSPLVTKHGRVSVARVAGVNTEGGAVESLMVHLQTYRDEKIARFENFELDQLDAALARFDELCPDPLKIPPNGAIRVSERFAQAFATGDLPLVRQHFRPEFVFEDRGKKALVTGNVETLIESGQYLVSRPGVRLDLPLLGTMGERIALQHEIWSGGSDGDAYALDRIRLIEIDAEGLFRAWTFFDPDDREAAFAEALERFVAGEAADCGAQSVWMRSNIAWGDRNWDAMRALFAEDAVIHDHRLLGFGRLDRDAWIESWRVGAELAPDVRAGVLRLLVWNEYGSVRLMRIYGTRDGGEFENVLLNVVVGDAERLWHLEFFAAEDAERAVARFEELCAARTS